VGCLFRDLWIYITINSPVPRLKQLFFSLIVRVCHRFMTGNIFKKMERGYSIVKQGVFGTRRFLRTPLLLVTSRWGTRDRHCVDKGWRGESSCRLWFYSRADSLQITEENKNECIGSVKFRLIQISDNFKIHDPEGAFPINPWI
jgi:hypothetical protein